MYSDTRPVDSRGHGLMDNSLSRFQLIVGYHCLPDDERLEHSEQVECIRNEHYRNHLARYRNITVPFNINKGIGIMAVHYRKHLFNPNVRDIYYKVYTRSFKKNEHMIKKTFLT